MRTPLAEKVSGDVRSDPAIESSNRGTSRPCRAFNIALGVLIAAVPLTYSGLAPGTLKWAVLGVLTPLIAFFWLWGGCGRPFRPLPKLLAPLSALLLVAILSLGQAINISYGLQRIAFLLVLLLLYLTVAYCSQVARQEVLISYLVLTLLVVSTLPLCGCATGFLLTSVTPVEFVLRLFGNTNYGMAHVLTVMPLSLALYLGSSKRLEKILWGTTLFVSMMLLTLSMVRGAWISIWVGLLVVVGVYFYRGQRARSFLRPRRSQIAPMVLVGSAILLAVALWPQCLRGLPSLEERVKSAFDHRSGSLQMRLAFWEGTVRLIQDHWWTGVGVGNFPLAFVPYRSAVIYQNPTMQTEHSHNEYLNLWAELGPLGLLALSWLLIRVIRLGRHLISRHEVRWEILAGVLGGLAASAAYANLFYVIHAPASAMNVAILLGMLDGMDGGVGHDRPERTVRPTILLVGLLVMGAFSFSYFLAPLAGEVYYSLANRDFRKGRMETGLSRLGRSLEWNPQSYVAQYRRATALFSLGRYPETIREAERALQIHPNLEIAYWVMGSAFLKLGDMPQAKAMFLQALDINPYYPHALNNLGVRALEEGRVAEAENLFLRAVESSGRRYAGPYVNLANLYESGGRVEAARRMYETAVMIDPDSGSLWYHVARSRALTGDLREAYEPLARAIAMDETWRARAAQDAAFASLRESDSRIRTLLQTSSESR